jgi:2-polyprenyl-6-methoxyphenol hydroxylase-like FAD-dependent oxidoreductase
MPATQVLIVGAGPTGLVLALCLAHRRVPFRIIEKNAGPGEASRAVAVQARTLELYRMLGVADGAVKRGIRIETIRLRAGGREAARLPVRTIGEGLSPYPYVLCLAQDDHERYLIEKLAEFGVSVEWNVELKSMSQDGNGVRAILSHAAGTEEVCEAAYLCGCDGAHSTTRHALGIDFPGGVYPQDFFVADVKTEGAWRTDLTANFGPDTLCLILPVRSSGMDRLIGTVPPPLSGRQGLTFEDVRPEAERLVGVRVTQVNWFTTYHVHHRVAAHFRVGRAFLSGDAGHIHSPAGGQGMNTGIGDAFNLAWKLADVIQWRAAEAILDTYEPERIAFARRLVATTDAVFRFIVDPGLRGRLVRGVLLPFLAPLFTSFAAVRRFMFDTISQTRISYRDSTLSEGQAGRVRAGDRMPWVAALDNFAPLSLDWRVQVHGEPAQGLKDVGLPLDVYPWTAAAYRAGLRRNAAYLLRPDGHVALAWPGDGRELETYLERHGLRFGRS